MKLSDLTDQQWFSRLSARRDRRLQWDQLWWSYYYGNQPMYHLIKLLQEQNDKFPALTINWCEKFIDSIDRRCFVEGFRVGDSDGSDDDLWAIWQRNDLGEYQSENNIASLVTADSYMVVGPSDEGALITVESPASMAIEIEPRTRRTIASLMFYKSDEEAALDDRAVLQVPDSTTGGSRMVEFENGKPVGSTKQEWMVGPRKLQSSPEVPVVQFPNRQIRRRGRSELTVLAPVVDAANMIATHMMATSHHHAMPRMVAINVAESQFFNADGSLNQDALKAATGSMWIIPSEADDDGNVPDNPAQIDVKQLPASDLRNFHETIAMLGRIGAGLCDLSPHTFGFGVADNPASADGIRASQDDFVARVERIQTARGTGYERVMRLAMAVEEKDPSTVTDLETMWRPASTPTKASMADAAVKTYGAGLSDLHQARVDYGYSATTIKSMEEREEKAGLDPYFDRQNVKDAAANAAAGSAPRGK